jgi:type II secretory ATPase GspE/PulE/Tfp pilus assembly ATPase PilB-like protein
VDLGVKPSSIGPAVSLIIAQRLVRRLCEKCKKPAKLPEDKASKIKSFLEKLPKRVSREPFFSFMNGGGQVFESAGCEACNNFGYKGRIGIFEFLRSGGSFEEAVLSSASESSLRKIASTQEMVTMQQDGILKVLKGETTFDEVESATGPMEWGVIES